MNTTDSTQKEWWTWTIKKVSKVWKDNSSCLHDNCSSCDGTGIRKDGLGPCVHMMSCSCPKCSPGRM